MRARLAAGALLVGGIVLGGGGGGGAEPALTITPAKGLTNGQEVQIKGTGFTPNASLGITQCADLGDKTGAGDCDLGAIKAVTADADGNVSATYAANAGPFGENQRSCNAQQ